MKKKCIITLVFVLLAGFASAQVRLEVEILEKLDIDEQDIEKIQEINTETNDTVQKAQAEVNIIRARIERLLLDADVSLGEVEKLLRSALEWELKMRMAQIERELSIRRTIGDEKWARLREAQRRLKERRRE
jgi:biopolymer transport protein ExbB/TolQ